MPNSGSSVALWYEPSSGTLESAEADLHINFWRFGPGRKPNYEGLLEIGLMLHDYEKVKKLHLALPAIIPSTDIHDLGSRFEQRKISTAIFNETLSVHATGHELTQKFVDLTINEDEHFARVCWLSEKDLSNNEDIFKRTAGTTELGINIEELTREWPPQKGRKVYFRFRIWLQKEALKPFLWEITPQDHYLQSGYEQYECIDFRFNRIRNISEESTQISVHNNSFHFKKINFFILADVEKDIMHFQETFSKTRLLEDDFWDQYFEIDGSVGRTAIYQWKSEPQLKQDGEEKPLTDLSVFVKLKSRNANERTMKAYLTIAALIALVGIFLNSLFQEIYAIIPRSWLLQVPWLTQTVFTAFATAIILLIGYFAFKKRVSEDKA